VKIITKQEFNKNPGKYMRLAKKEIIGVKPNKNSFVELILMNDQEYDGMCGY